LRSKAKSRSESFISRIEPEWTKPAQLNSTSTAADLGDVASASVLMSVAWTLAPAAAKAAAVARPMPWPAAVMRTVLPESLLVMSRAFSGSVTLDDGMRRLSLAKAQS
jgi:hypothetical protein